MPYQFEFAGRLGDGPDLGDASLWQPGHRDGRRGQLGRRAVEEGAPDLPSLVRHVGGVGQRILLLHLVQSDGLHAAEKNYEGL